MYYADIATDVSTLRIVSMFAYSSDYNAPCTVQRLSDTTLRAYSNRSGGAITVSYTYI